MNKQILNYRKTEHFLYRQWDRGISDDILSKLLVFCPKDKPNLLVVVSREAIHQLGIKRREELFIKLDKNLLITCYFGAFQEYLFSTRQEQDYLIINSLAPNAKN